MLERVGAGNGVRIRVGVHDASLAETEVGEEEVGNCLGLQVVGGRRSEECGVEVGVGKLGGRGRVADLRDGPVLQDLLGTCTSEC